MTVPASEFSIFCLRTSGLTQSRQITEIRHARVGSEPGWMAARVIVHAHVMTGLWRGEMENVFSRGFRSRAASTSKTNHGTCLKELLKNLRVCFP